MDTVGELACTYATLILQDDGIPITSEKISTIVNSANLKIESYWPTLFEKLLDKRSASDLILILSVGSVYVQKKQAKGTKRTQGMLKLWKMQKRHLDLSWKYCLRFFASDSFLELTEYTRKEVL